MTIRSRIPGFVAAALLGLTAILGPAAAASAGPPEINQKDCEAAGGTFDRVKGVKSCTTTTTSTQFTGPFSSFYSGGVFGTSYQATWREQTLLQTTTTDSQKGNGEITTQQSWMVLSRQVINQMCWAMTSGFMYSVPSGDCATRGMYPIY